MFQLEENNQKIGSYLRRLVNKKYDSERKFCKAYLRLNGIPADDEETRKMQNRFSQIFNGKKRIQTYDLPFVTELLGVSCEEILSAGKCYVPVSSHVTNYDVALSKDPKVWQSYIDREDRLILNYDEYGKSVLDYAFDFNNYGFLKYLTDKGYIKFRDTADTDFRYNFGAITTIKRRDITHTDWLEAEISYSDKLRMNMLNLAMKNHDFSVLDMLHARETPQLHFAAVYSVKPDETEMYDCSDIVENIAAAPDETIDYFSTEYSVMRENATKTTCFLYQHLGDVIAKMIEKRNDHVIRVIEKATAHNNKVYSFIKDILADAVQNTMKKQNCSKADANMMIFKLNNFYENCNVVRMFVSGTDKSIVANIIHADVETTNADIMKRLLALNISYDRVRIIAEKGDE